MADVYGFKKNDAEHILTKSRMAGHSLHPSGHLEPKAGASFGIVQSGGISARSSTTAGSGTVTIYYLDGTTITSGSRDITVYNLGTSSVSSGDYVTVIQEFITGQWILSEVA